MSFANIAFYIAILGFIVYRRVQGKPVGSAKQLFVLPVLLCVLGYQDLAHQSPGTVDVVFAAAGSALSLGLGAVRGSVNKLYVRQGATWMRWGAASVTVFAVNVAAKLVLDVISVAAGGTTSGATSSLLLAAGLMLGGEGAVVWLRLQTSPPPALGSQGAIPTPMTTSKPPVASGSGVGPQPAETPQPSAPPRRVEMSRVAESLLRRLADRITQD